MKLMSKFYVKDDEGSTYAVEEVTEAPAEEPVVDEEPMSAGLSDEEIDALRRLAAVADQLISMCQTTDADPEEMEEEKVEDEDPIEEEIVDTDSERMNQK